MGIEKGTLYRQTEGLLLEYRAMTARKKILETELTDLGGQGITENPDEAIEGYYFSRTINGMPHGTELSDKTARVALDWSERYRKEFHTVWRMYVLDRENLRNELIATNRMIRMIDISINSLLEKERQIITAFYIDGMTWEQISAKMQYGERQCRRLRDRGVWYMSKSMTARWKVF